VKTLVPLLLLTVSLDLQAQSGELWVSGGASILTTGARYSHRDIGSPSADGQTNDVQLSNGFRFGFRLDLNSAGRLGHEIEYAYNRTKFIDNTGTLPTDVSGAGTAIHQAGTTCCTTCVRTRRNRRSGPSPR
jgi:hypothetical protein